MADARYERVTKRYGAVTALSDLTLSANDGEFLVLVGPSGCGKTTALRCLAGLEEPDEGAVFIGDEEITFVEPKDRDIAMVFQNYALYPHMNVFENIAFSMKMRKANKREMERRVTEVAGMLGIGDLLKRRPRELSGGQRQRVALGRAIVREPQVFLMDEPLSNLDARLRVQTRTELIKLHQQLGTTTIYVTHDQVEAMTMGTRIAVLLDGVLQQIAAPLELYDLPANTFVASFIGNPPMNLLSAAVDRQAGNLATELGRLPLSDRQLEALGSRDDVTLGVRAEHVAPVPAGDPSASLTVEIDIIEALGSDQYLFGHDNRFVARVEPRMPVTTGDVLHFHVQDDALHLFDSDTGARIPVETAGSHATVSLPASVFSGQLGFSQ